MSFPIDPKAIARERGIEVVEKPMESEGVSGMLVRFGNDFAIAYATFASTFVLPGNSTGGERLGSNRKPRDVVQDLAACDPPVTEVKSISNRAIRGISGSRGTQPIRPHRKEDKAAALRGRSRCIRHRSVGRTHKHP